MICLMLDSVKNELFEKICWINTLKNCDCLVLIHIRNLPYLIFFGFPRLSFYLVLSSVITINCLPNAFLTICNVLS